MHNLLINKRLRSQCMVKKQHQGSVISISISTCYANLYCQRSTDKTVYTKLTIKITVWKQLKASNEGCSNYIVKQ